MSEPTQPQKPKHPPELVALWHRRGDWALIPDERWRQAREDLRRFCEAGWADTAYKLGWPPSGLYGLNIKYHWGLVARLNGGSILALGTDCVLIRQHDRKKTIAFRKPSQRVIAAA